MGIYVTDHEGKQQPLYLASYGIGITRAMGVIVEKFADGRGIIWPENVAPYKVYLVRLGDSEEVVKQADDLYETLGDKGVEVLYDDRDARAGEKFADADLLGIPHRVVISEKMLAKGKLEYKNRSADTAEELKRDILLAKII
jgi:prolyl-tRNA synthetase